MQLNNKKSTFKQWPTSGVIAFFVILSFLIIPLHAQAIEYKGIGLRPAFPREGNPRTEDIFIHTIKPGDVVEDGARVINNTDVPKTLLVYAADYLAASSGGFACRQYVEEKKEVGSWIKMEKEELTLPPQSNEVVKFTITVPPTADVGEQNGCIVVQEKNPAPANPNNPNDTAPGMNLSFRTGLRIALTIPGDIKKGLKIVDFNAGQRSDGNVLFTANIENIGNVSVDTSVKVKTSNLLNKTIIEHGGQYPLLRGKVYDFNYEWKRPFWGGIYFSQLTAEYDPSFVSELGQKSDTQTTVLKSVKKVFFVWPALPALLIELFVILALLYLFFKVYRKNRLNKKVQQTWVRYKVKPQDDITDIAKKVRVKWKTLAFVNHIKPPYILVPGQFIKIPPGKDIEHEIEAKDKKAHSKPKKK